MVQQSQTQATTVDQTVKGPATKKRNIRILDNMTELVNY